MELHPDFSEPWCKELLGSAGVEIIDVPDREGPVRGPANATTLFARTLNTEDALRAQISFRRPTKEADAVGPMEYCLLLSVGAGVDGKPGRAHGGFNALLLDQTIGLCASQATKTAAPATAQLTVDYKAPIVTPCLLLCRAWATSLSGRKAWARGVIEDGTGKVFAAGKGLFISAKEPKL